MNTKLIIGCGVLLMAACAGETEDKARTREEFCADWANAACSAETVSACQAKDATSCRQRQDAYCLKLVPVTFSDATGDACLDAVGKAYADGDLKDTELATVLALGKPCDQLIKGPKARGEECVERRDCDSPAGFDCVKKSTSERGTCQIPESTIGGRDCSAGAKACEAGNYCNGMNCVETKDAGASCTIQDECGATGFCNDNGKCAERAGNSETCTSDDQCLKGVCYEFEGKKTCTDRIVLSRAEPLCEDLR